MPSEVNLYLIKTIRYKITFKDYSSLLFYNTPYFINGFI